MWVMNTIEFGDCRETMRRWAQQGVKAQTCVTSPPYFGLRDYGHDGQLGLEQTPEEYIAAMVDVFRAVRDVLADDGTLWLNIGDSYARDPGKGGSGPGGKNRDWYGDNYGAARGADVPSGCKPKDLIGIPWMLAFALRADGWYLRQEIIWHKPNPMPESVTDRCTKAHEQIFLLSKAPRYFFDSEAMKEPAVATSPAGNGFAGRQGGAAHMPMSGGAGSDEPWRPRSARDSFKRTGSKRQQAIPGQTVGTHREDREESDYDPGMRNRRSVWTVATRPYKGAHFATFPPDLIRPCILAGSREGDTVLDPFMGSGTTAQVALKHGRRYLGCELNPAYELLQLQRIYGDLA